MRVLHVVHRVVVVLCNGQIHIEGVLRVGLAAQQKEANRVLAGPLDQVAQRDVAARAFADLDLFTALDHAHHGVQHIVGVALGDAHIGRLQPGAHAGDGAVVVGALDVDDLGVTTLPLGDVVSHVGHEVGVGAVALAHDAVLVVAVVGGLEPQRAVLLVGLAVGHELVDSGFDAAAGVQAGFEVVLVKVQIEGLQVLVLLVAQVGHCKLADVVVVLHVAVGGELTVVGLDGGLGLEGLGNVGDVVAVVEGLARRVFRVDGPAFVAGFEALGAQLGAVGQGLNLHACVVVIELAVHAPALRGEQVADGVTNGRLAAMADVQRPGGVGRDEFDQHARIARALETEALPGSQHLAHDFLLGRWFQANVDEAGARDVDVGNPALVNRRGKQRGAQALCHLAGIELEWLGQLHGRGAGEVSMGGHLGRFKCGLGARAGGEGFQLGRERGQQILFDREHRAILRGRCQAAARPRALKRQTPARMCHRRGGRGRSGTQSGRKRYPLRGLPTSHAPRTGQ